MVLGSILICLSFQNLPSVTGIDISIQDPEDDVVKLYFPFTYADSGDYFDEIDIINFEINGQITNITVAGSLTDWEGDYYSEQKIARVMIFETFDWEVYKSFDLNYPYYSVSYRNWTYAYDYHDVFFLKHINQTYEEYWTGSGYSYSEYDAQSIGYGIGSSIIGNVSKTDYIIPNNATIFAFIQCATVEDMTIMIYVDFAPEEFNIFVESKDEIPGYSLWIVAIAVIGTSFYIVSRKIKK